MSANFSGLPSVSRCFGMLASGFALLTLAASAPALAQTRSDSPIIYTNHVVSRIPLSIHVIKIDRKSQDLRFSTILGGGSVLGMASLTDQLKVAPPELGAPLAAINGDFYEKAKGYPGRPRDLQIWNGEVVSHPSGHACFWIDANGQPRMTNIYSRFRVLWPAGNETPFWLNVERTNNTVVLYTAVIGPSTLTKGGIEYQIEDSPAPGGWRPLGTAQTREVRVVKVSAAGNTPLTRGSAVLSISPELTNKIPILAPGALLRLRTETVPDLPGVEMAIGGGPTLVENGKVLTWSGWVHLPHPRTAVGWSRDHIFFVVVDGRQLDVSLGMTFSELASYMLSLGCEQAMNLDGGGSAALWAFGSLRSNPSEGQERPAPNALMVVKKTAAPAQK